MANETFGGPFPAFIASTQSVDYGAMTAGVATVQVTVEGAEPGDAILVSKTDGTSTFPDSDQLYGYCDTADLVDLVVVDNDNTATTNHAAVNVAIVVFKAS